jgi:hypothetical protein
MSSILFQHTSFKSFVAKYNFDYAPKKNNRFFLNEKRLCEVFYTHYLLNYYKEFLELDLKSNNKIIVLF